MTSADEDPVWAFVQALPARIKGQLQRTERLVALVHTATREQGWTPQRLAERCAGGNVGINPAGVVMYRLEHCSKTPAELGHEGPRRVHQGCCEDGWLYDESGDEVRAVKCPGNMQEATA